MPKIVGKGFEKYMVEPVGPGHALFSHVKSFPDVVNGPRGSWAMTRTNHPDIFYPTEMSTAAPGTIHGVKKFKREGNNYFPVF